MASSKQIQEVRKWWNERIVAGTQLGYSEEFDEGWDYFGKSPWKDAVAHTALHSDFIKWYYDEYKDYRHTMLSEILFMPVFYNLVPGVSKARLVGTLDIKTIGPVKRERSFVVFGKQPLTPLPL